MAVCFFYLIKWLFQCTLLYTYSLDKPLFTRYQKHSAMFNWSPCRFRVRAINEVGCSIPGIPSDSFVIGKACTAKKNFRIFLESQNEFCDLRKIEPHPYYRISTNSDISDFFPQIWEFLGKWIFENLKFETFFLNLKNIFCNLRWNSEISDFSQTWKFLGR